MKKRVFKSTKATGLSKLAREQGVTRQAVFNRAKYRRNMAAGLCPCGQEKRDWNAKLGKPYSQGPKCRKRHNERMKLRMRAAYQEKRNGESGKRKLPLF